MAEGIAAHVDLRAMGGNRTGNIHQNIGFKRQPTRGGISATKIEYNCSRKRHMRLRGMLWHPDLKSHRLYAGDKISRIHPARCSPGPCKTILDTGKGIRG